MPTPMIAIVGRPNVGKSTLFNRLLQRRHAIEDDQSGVTRDRISARMDWNGIPFTLVDTGGLMPRGGEELDRLVSSAAEAAVSEADKVVVVVDGQVGPSEMDEEVARMILRAGLPAILAVTKIDVLKHEVNAWEYLSLGLGDPIPVSGMSGMNTGDLLDEVVQGFETFEDREETGEIKLALVGRPNVGKSSLLNKLLGKEQQIVYDKPGTTRDAVDFTMKYHEKTIRLVDTAGLKRSKELRKESLEYYTALRTIRAIDRCEVACVLMEGHVGLTQHDRRLLDDIRNRGKGAMLAVNKWDLVEKDHMTMVEFEREIRLQLPDLSFVPMVFISALTGHRARKVLDLTLQIHEERGKRIPTAKLNSFAQAVFEEKPPPAVKGKWLKVKYVSQIKSAPPLFVFFMNYPKLMPEHYKRFLERRIREEFGFEGVPIKVVFRQK